MAMNPCDPLRAPVLALMLFAVPIAATAQTSATAGRDLAASCAACHGTEGRATGAFIALAGRPRDELIASLNSFRDGTRTASVMHQHAKGYSDAEFVLIADYFSRPPREQK